MTRLLQIIGEQMGGKSPSLSLNSRDRSFCEQTFPQMMLAGSVCFCFRESLGFNPISKAFSRQMQVRLRSCDCRNQAAWETLLLLTACLAAAQLLHPHCCLLLSGTDVFPGWGQGRANLHPGSAGAPAATKAHVNCSLSSNLCS